MVCFDAFLIETDKCTVSKSIQKKVAGNKELRARGKPYTIIKGKQKPAKIPAALYNEQHGTYLMNHINEIPVAWRRHGKYEDPADSKQQCTIVYSVPTKKRTCSGMCKNIYRYFPSYQLKTSDTQ
ncbi:hypothetical protein PR048_032942 [Dryococelus australis]|uniref:Uncharacterized protein n=1 Tax=Dryococelus australis TaxID=614101 RepID=A0ABQ9G3P2_9NEOP|nr:hypothetical protein PR048_032942 [Dryococelus australis]